MTKSKTRTKSTGEVFTPPELVDEIVTKLYEASPELFTNRDKMFLDPACGDGEFLLGVIRKLKKVLGKKFTKNRWEHTIKYQLLGVDLMWDNTCDTVYHLLRSWEELKRKKTEKDVAYPILKQYRGKESRKEVMQRIVDATGCATKAAVPLYSWSTYTKDWIQKHENGLIVETTFENGFELQEHHTPDEVNRAFESRSYKDICGSIIIRPQKGSDHYVEYKIDDGEWTPVENIVRANSLTEWDFENWCFKKTPQPVANQLLEF